MWIRLIRSADMQDKNETENGRGLPMEYSEYQDL